MPDDRKLLCRSCHHRTRHERAGATLLPALTQFVGILGVFWFCLPILLPILGVLFLVSLLVPLQCVVCGRWTWRRGRESEEWITDIEEPEVETTYDTIRIERKAFVASEEEMVPIVKRLVRAIEREGPAFKLYGYTPARDLRPVRTLLKNLVRAFVMTSEIQWNFGREPSDPTHKVRFFSIHQSAVGGVNLQVKFVLEGNEATRPGLEVILELSLQLPTKNREALLSRLQLRCAAIVGADATSVERVEV